MQVRKALKEDIAVLVENNLLLAKESENEQLDKELVKKGVTTLFSHPEKGFYIVVENDGDIIGQLMITFEWSDWRNSDIWWIQSVYIRSDFRKKGVFTTLFDVVKKQAKKNDVPLLRLYVHNTNKNAQKVYEAKKMKTSNAYDLKKIGYSTELSEGIVSALKNYENIDLAKYVALIEESVQYLKPGKESLPETSSKKASKKTSSQKTEKPEESSDEDDNSEEVEELVLSTIKKIEGDDGAPWDVITENCDKQGLSSDSVEEALNALMDKGLIYEPVLGTIKTT